MESLKLTEIEEYGFPQTLLEQNPALQTWRLFLPPDSNYYEPARQKILVRGCWDENLSGGVLITDPKNAHVSIITGGNNPDLEDGRLLIYQKSDTEGEKILYGKCNSCGADGQDAVCAYCKSTKTDSDSIVVKRGLENTINSPEIPRTIINKGQSSHMEADLKTDQRILDNRLIGVFGGFGFAGVSAFGLIFYTIVTGGQVDTFPCLTGTTLSGLMVSLVSMTGIETLKKKVDLLRSDVAGVGYMLQEQNYAYLWQVPVKEYENIRVKVR